MAFLIIRHGKHEDVGRIIALKNSKVLVGRRASDFVPDIELHSDFVSRRHAEITMHDGKYYIRDLGSTNGTMLNDDRIQPGRLHELKHGGLIGLGLDGDIPQVLLAYRETEDTQVSSRSKKQEVKPAIQNKVRWLKLDDEKKEILVDGVEVKLSKKEYWLIRFLSRNAGKICSRDEIIDAVWPDSQDPAAISDATIDQLVHRLREKVEPEPSNPVRIISKKAFGYMLV